MKEGVTSKSERNSTLKRSRMRGVNVFLYKSIAGLLVAYLCLDIFDITKQPIPFNQTYQRAFEF